MHELVQLSLCFECKVVALRLLFPHTFAATWINLLLFIGLSLSVEIE